MCEALRLDFFVVEQSSESSRKGGKGGPHGQRSESLFYKRTIGGSCDQRNKVSAERFVANSKYLNVAFVMLSLPVYLMTFTVAVMLYER